MMNVVSPDIRGEPAQNTREVIIGTTVKRRLVQIPSPFVKPCSILELMLHIEQPDPDRGREEHDWQMHEQEWADPDQPNHDGDENRDGGVGCHGAEPWPPTTAHAADWQPMLHNKQI